MLFMSLTACVYAVNGSANSTTITVIGEVRQAACIIDINSIDIPVYLGDVSTYKFHNVGDSSSPIEFTITLNECPLTTTKSLVKFDGFGDPNNNTLLRLDNISGSAKGVGIGIYDATGKQVPLWTASSNYPITTGTNVLRFTAKFVASILPVTAGAAEASSDFTINYS